MDSAQKFLPTDLPEKIPSDFPEEYSQPQRYSEVKTLLAWSAPGRPYIKRGKQFYSTAILIAFLLEVILFLFSQHMLMLVVLALLFMSFSFALVPPRSFHYRISTEGITIEDHYFIWDELYDFYFRRREGIDVLYIRTHAFIPGILNIPLGSVDKAHIQSVLLPYLPYREVVKPTYMEKSADWLVKNFPLEKSKS
jgi:hypothetical protein